MPSTNLVVLLWRLLTEKCLKQSKGLVRRKVCLSPRRARLAAPQPENLRSRAGFDPTKRSSFSIPAPALNTPNVSRTSPEVNAFYRPMIDIEDKGQLLRYLRETGRIGVSERPTIRTLSGGISNKTLSLTRSSGESWVIKQSLPKLRVASDWFSDPPRIQVEANGLRYL